jgi:serine/threonine-protein kinase
VTRAAGTRIDHYELVEHLADGAQAEVHRAQDLRTGREVTVKFPHPHTLEHPTLVARWRRELRLTEHVSHSGIQCRLEIGERHREPYVVLDYASGGSLRGWVGGTLPVGQVIAWGRELAVALAYLHRLGVVHRDLKPENILVNSDLTIKLGDFGSAMVIKGESFWRRWLAVSDPTEGTADYLSPEQILGRTGDERSDIYGWGVLMYELLTGTAPFTVESPDTLALMEAHLRTDPVPVRVLRPDVPAALEAVVMTAMRRFPEHRFGSALAVVDALDGLDELDLSLFDLSPEPPLEGVVATGETLALFRLAAVVAAGFIGVVFAAVAATAVLR